MEILNLSKLKSSAMSDHFTNLTLFMNFSSLKPPSGFQEFNLFALCAILSYHTLKRVLFSAKMVTGKVTEVSNVFSIIGVNFVYMSCVRGCRVIFKI